MSMGVGMGKSVPMRPETWKPIPGFSKYEASDLGRIRNLDGLVLSAGLNNRGYLKLNLIDDEGRVQTPTVHRLIMAASLGRPLSPGEVVRHLNDVPTDNRQVNLAVGSQGDNERDKYANGRPKPVPPRKAKTCILCKREFEGNGRRCHACVVDLGKRAANLLSHGTPLGEVAKVLDYPSVEGIHRLAVVYGGYGQQPQRRGVAVTLRDRLRGVTRRDRPRGGDAA
jgi:hypothetical protein